MSSLCSFCLFTLLLYIRFVRRKKLPKMKKKVKFSFEIKVVKRSKDSWTWFSISIHCKSYTKQNIQIGYWDSIIQLTVLRWNKFFLKRGRRFCEWRNNTTTQRTERIHKKKKFKYEIVKKLQSCYIPSTSTSSNQLPELIIKKNIAWIICFNFSYRLCVFFYSS